MLLPLPRVQLDHHQPVVVLGFLALLDAQGRVVREQRGLDLQGAQAGVVEGDVERGEVLGDEDLLVVVGAREGDLEGGGGELWGWGC